LSESVDGDTNKGKWRLTITDNGTGISRDDLAYMLKIGGSRNNKSRQSEIEKMPEWMKPSGAFGIGFQSVFLVTDKVVITTKSVFSNEKLQVVMHNPRGENEGLVTIKPMNSAISESSGSKIEFELTLSNILNQRFVHGEGFMSNKLAKNYDPVLDDNLPYFAARLIDNVYEFSKYCMLNVSSITSFINAHESFAHINLETADSERKLRLVSVTINDEPVQLFINYKVPEVLYGNYRDSEYRFRGQAFSFRQHQHTPFIVELDILSGKAGQWLSINRDTIKNTAYDDLDSVIEKALYEVISEDLKEKTIENKPWYSYMLHGLVAHYGTKWKQLVEESSLKDNWLDLDFDGYTAKELLNGQKKILISHYGDARTARELAKLHDAIFIPFKTLSDLIISERTVAGYLPAVSYVKPSQDDFLNKHSLLDYSKDVSFSYNEEYLIESLHSETYAKRILISVEDTNAFSSVERRVLLENSVSVYYTYLRNKRL